MKKSNAPILRVELQNGTVLEGIEVQLKDSFQIGASPFTFIANEQTGMWLKHIGSNKVSFLANETIVSKRIIK